MLGDVLDGVVRRVLEDALVQASAVWWDRRAAVYDACAPRPGEYTGQASRAELSAAWWRCRADAARCRAHAALLRGEDLLDPEHADDVELVIKQARRHPGAPSGRTVAQETLTAILEPPDLPWPAEGGDAA